MSVAKNYIILNIKGREWRFILMTDKSFDKLHNPNGESHTGMTLTNQYEVHFRKSDWCLVDVFHELGHVLFSMNESSTVAGLTADQVEETMCQILAKNYFEIGTWAGHISEKFFGRE